MSNFDINNLDNNLPNNSPEGPITPNHPGQNPDYPSKDPAHPGKEALNKFKYEMANDIGLPPLPLYNGDFTASSNYVGSYMVKKMIEAQEKQMNKQGK